LNDDVKSIRLSKHALDYAEKRGFTVAEVEESIRTSSWGAAELGRLDCRKDFAYGKEWNGRVLFHETGSPGVYRGGYGNCCDHRLYLLF
jgi:hypothetical protein